MERVAKVTGVVPGLTNAASTLDLRLGDGDLHDLVVSWRRPYGKDSL